MTIQEGGDASEATVFRAHALPQGACENLVCALAPLAHLQAGGHNLVDAIFEVLHEHGRLETTNELRWFIEKGQPRGGEHLRLGEDPGIAFGGEAYIDCGLPLQRWCVKKRMN